MINIKEKVDFSLVTESVSTPDFEQSFDVAVIGLGASGAIAAIVSAKNGLKTLGVERLNSAGGTMTMGGICGYYFGSRGGAFDKVDEQLKTRSNLVIKREFVHPDLRKYNLDCEMEKAGVTAMLESVVTAVFTDGRKIVGIKVFDGTCERSFAVKVLIDATGEGEVCEMAGCEMTFGRECDQSVVPFTISKCSVIEGQIEKTNHDSGKIDQRNPKEFSRAVLEGQAFFVKRTKGQRVIRLHSLPGIREGRLLKGEKRLTAEGFLNGERENEPVFYSYSDLDKHGYDVAFDSPTFKKWDLMSNLGALNITIPIPKECFIAKEYDNFAVAGRCLSVDHEMQTCVRMNRDMQKSGEVAAVLAKLSIDKNIPLKDVAYSEIKPILEASGCLSEENNRGFWYDGANSPEGYIRKAVWLTEEAEIVKALSSLKPGLAIWSCRLLGDKIKPLLKDSLKSENRLLACHSAFALAVMEDSSSAEVLRETVVLRDRTELMDMRKHNKLHIAMAACGLGVIKDMGSIEILKDLVTDYGEAEFYENFRGFKRNYYRTVSVAVASLMEIAEAHPERYEEIKEFLLGEFLDLSYIPRMTENNEYTSEYAMCKDIFRNIKLWIERYENR